MSSSVPPKGSDVANEKLREMGAGTAIGHQGGSANSDTRSVESNDRVNSSLAGGMTLGPPINVNRFYIFLVDGVLVEFVLGMVVGMVVWVGADASIQLLLLSPALTSWCD
ncbi:unnamed protein product [Rotaria sp. Silwood1]|nr:unnamed protein product [Rotaria sp. Silwood1]